MIAKPLFRVIVWAAITLILNTACAHVSMPAGSVAGRESQFRCRDRLAYEMLLAPVAGGARQVAFQQLAPVFDSGDTTTCAQSSFTARIHDVEKGCLCCVTLDVKGDADSCSYKVQSIYVFYSASSRGDVDRSMQQFMSELLPTDGALIDTIQVRPGEAVHTYRIGNIQYEFTVAIYRHHGIWTGSLTVINYDLPEK